MCVILAFQNATDVEAIRVTPRDLQADVVYELYSADRGVLGRLAGSVLMRDGFEVPASPVTRGHVFLLSPAGQASALRK